MADVLPEPLNERELEILACLADGLTNQEIAHKLFLAEQTVRWYNSQIYSKLGVNKRKEALERAHALGLLQESAPAPTISGKHNLPSQATPFIGREHELTELFNLLKDENTRLITILAPGGMGKTRLALETARLQIGRYGDGVIFVPLAPLSSPSDIVTTIAENIGFIFHGENPPSQQLTDFLRERSMFLVLDNFEHLMDGVQLVADLIQAAPQVRLLATSRERLSLRSETVYSLRGLEFPTWETPEDALQYAAVKLFMQSAHRVRAEFTLQAHDLDYLARICRLTAGMPLGIELAAGWVDVLSLEQIASEIQKGIDILETEMRDVPERQRSIRATFDHSWERLAQDEQAVFMRLSVFRGGFTVHAAQAVAGASVRSLKQLANKALVQVSPDGRHYIHELLRQFGAEKLIASGKLPTIQAAHADYFANFMAERKQDIKGSRQLEALELIDHDFENVRSAWFYTLNQHQWDAFPKFLHSLWFYLDLRTRGQDGSQLLGDAAKLLESQPYSPETELALARVLTRLGWFYSDAGFFEKGLITCDRAIRILRQDDSSDDLLAALHARHNAAAFQNRTDIGRVTAKEGLSIAYAIGDKSWQGVFSMLSGISSYDDGDYGTARDYAKKALAIFESLGDHWYFLRTYGILIEVAHVQEDYRQMSHWMQQWEPIAVTFGHVFSLAMGNVYRGQISLAEGNFKATHLYLSKALKLFWDAGYFSVISYPLVYFVKMYVNHDETDRAAEILAFLDNHRMSWLNVDVIANATRNQLEMQMEPERFAIAWTRGEKRELSEVVTELLAEFET